MDDNETRQLNREKAQREAAKGQRARSVLRGDLGPVLRRWVSATVLPVASRVRLFAECQQGGQFEQAGLALHSPVFGLPEATRSRDLGAILAWCLKGQSKGRAEHGTTYAEDLVLAVLGTAMMLCSGAEREHAKRTIRTLSTVVFRCGQSARETAMGQFITEVQGTKAMLRVRRGKEHTWQETKQMDAIAALLAGQVRSALGDTLVDGVQSAPVEGSREVVEVLTPKGENRQIRLRVPGAEDWALLEVARKVRGEADVHQATWGSFAMVVICAAQAEAGLFDLQQVKVRREGRAAHSLVLSGAAQEAITRDLEKWLGLGFIKEPTVVPPVNGDYLSVKHRAVAGGAGPKGIRTEAFNTDAWMVASEVMAATAWTVATETLAFVQSPEGAAYAEASEADSGRRPFVLGSYARLAQEEALYFPIYMDFRGRVYTRPTVVTYQGNDLQKGLLCFPADEVGNDLTADAEEALILHCAALYGGPEKLDKASFPKREAWWYSIAETPLSEVVAGADEPIQLYTALSLVRSNQADRVPCQIDGTCNGLQHLSALFRDETAAPHVNLCASTLEDTPADIYARVGEEVARRLAQVEAPWAYRLRATLRIDRKLCKAPVMVLPYGGTRGTIEEAVLEAVVGQDPKATVNGRTFSPWHECLTYVDHQWVRDEQAISGDYLVFRERDLGQHPLLRKDAQKLGGIVWDSIVAMLPRPMAAMAAFRAIAKAVGGRSLEWRMGTAHVAGLRSTPTGSAGGDETGELSGQGPRPLWIVQAKPLSAAHTIGLKGLHLPGSVRGLGMRLGRDEVDPRAHTSGIVANFIHSQDADHLRLTMQTFREALKERGPGERTMRLFAGEHGPTSIGKSSTPCFGAIHDCFLTRPSLIPALGRACREAFAEKYSEADHPLHQPVRLRDIHTGECTVFSSWYALAESCQISFPELGSWNPKEVMHSAWFFS